MSLIDVDTGKAWNIVMKQITKENKEGCVKDRSGKKNDKNKNKEKRKVGRPKGSTNKDKSKVKLSKYFNFVQDTLTEVLNIINKSINIVPLLSETCCIIKVVIVIIILFIEMSPEAMLFK